LDIGRLREKLKNPSAARNAYAQVLHGYPESGNALSAAKRWVALCVKDGVFTESEAWQTLLTQHEAGPLDAGIRYHLARSLEDEHPVEALLQYQELVRLHPLPRGTFTDDALLSAARLRRRLGDAQGAIETLKPLLEQPVRAAIVGSYRRTSYLDAHFLAGHILRDDLNDPSAALDVFAAFVATHGESRRWDDALYEIIVTEAISGVDPCPSAERLRQSRPDSRLNECARKICEGTLEPRNPACFPTEP
jgi:tetratricopeptide (TPR) repeat protein